MKYCTNCGNKLPENAGMCVKCGKMIENVRKPNKNKKMPAWAIVLIVIGTILYLVIGLITLLVTAFNSDEFDEVIDEIPNIIQESGVVGDTLYTDNYRVTLTDTKRYDSIGEDTSKIEAKDGKEFLVLFFDIENISSDTVIISEFDFSGYVDDYKTMQTTFLGEIDGYKYIIDSLKPDTKARGFVIYEVDKDWKNFKIYLKDGLFSDEKVYFSVDNVKRIDNGL